MPHTQFDLFNPFRSIVPDARCPRCLDTRVWLTPTNQVEYCPRSCAAPQTNPAAFLMGRAAWRLRSMGIHINPFAFDLARILTHHTTDQPCLRVDLLEFFFAETNLSGANRLRKFHELVEDLRKIWLLPIGSRKYKPSGYWIITDLEDFKAWFERVKVAPITQLSTIHKVARANFPIFAEQMELDFWKNINAEEKYVDD